MIEQLSQYQHDLLRKLANGNQKAFACLSAVETDDDRVNIQQEFIDVKDLIRLKLVADVSKNDAFKKLVQENWDELGRQTVIVNIRRVADIMFKRTAWDKQIN